SILSISFRVPAGKRQTFCVIAPQEVIVLRHRPPGVHSAYSVFSDSVKNDTGYLHFNSIAWQGCVAFLLHCDESGLPDYRGAMNRRRICFALISLVAAVAGPTRADVPDDSVTI